MRSRAASRGAAISVTFLLVAAGCTDAGKDVVDPQPVADELAAGLSAFDLGGVEVDAPNAQRQLAAAVELLGDARPTVTAGSVEQGDTTATAELAYSWDLDADEEPDWSYTTTARLEPAGDAWQVAWTPQLLAPELAAGEQLDVSSLGADRGDILGAGDAVLVTERPVFRVGIDKTRVSAQRGGRSARALARLVGVEVASYVEQVGASGPEAFVEAIVLREEEVPEQLRVSIQQITGGVLVPDDLPLAPTREFARSLLGTVGEATAEMIEESDGRLGIGDQAGISGLQARYDDLLAGRPGMLVEAVTAAGSRVVHRQPPTPGEPVRTTLEPDLQRLAERILQPLTPAGAIVAIRPSDGAVLAAAEGPGSDGLPTALEGHYAPGSTFKVASALALLRSGLTPASAMQCPASTTVEGKAFGNYGGYPPADLGRITLRTAIASSCNTALVSAAKRISPAELTAAAASLGLGVDQDLGAPAFLGSVPADSPGVEHAAAMIGQARIEASPLAMATVAASVAAGETVAPRLVLSPQPAEPAEPEQPLTSDEGDQLRALMRAVVTDGSASFLADVPGPAVAAKTGTAEYGTALPLRTHAWMIAAQGDLAVAVLVADGVSGSRTAGPLVERLLRGA
jgi:cell division protein FtsI/penicillin-binding protein 2